MNQFAGFAVWGLLSLASCASHAEIFLNDPVLLEQKQVYGELAGLGDKQGDSTFQAHPPSLTDIHISSPASPELRPVDPGFTPSHEVMRETEAKREADDRLWQSVLSVFE